MALAGFKFWERFRNDPGLDQVEVGGYQNRIKEVKNVCFSDRLSCLLFSANFFRLMLSCLAYELLRNLRELIRKTVHTKAVELRSLP